MTSYLHEHAEWIAPGNLMEGNFDLIHALELKLWHFKVSPYVCIGKPRICNVLSPGVRYLENRLASTCIGYHAAGIVSRGLLKG